MYPFSLHLISTPFSQYQVPTAYCFRSIMLWFNKTYSREEFFQIFYEEDVSLIRSILYWQGDLANAEDQEWRPLAYACYRGNTELARAILEIGGKRVDINQRDRMGYTPLLWAISKDHYEIAHMLLNRNDIDVNVKSKDDETPLLLATAYNRPMIVQRLLYHGARINVRDKEGETPLSRACLRDHFTIVQMLLNAGANPNTQSNRCGHTPLAEACILNYVSLVELLIQAGADVNAVNHHGSTAVLLAVKGGSIDAIHVLLKHGAGKFLECTICMLNLCIPLTRSGSDLNIPNDGNETPMMTAVANMNIGAIQILMEHDAHMSDDADTVQVGNISLPIREAGILTACM